MTSFRDTPFNTMEVRQRVKSHPGDDSESHAVASGRGTREDIYTHPAADDDDAGEQVQYVPLRILEKRVLSFTQTTVPHALGRLQQHRENMVRLHQESDWSRLNSEQMNANRTVQHLKSHIRTLDELRHEVDPKDLATFDRHTQNIRTQILTAIEDYGMATIKLNSIVEEDITTCTEGGNEDGDREEEEQVFDDLTSVSDQSVLIPREEAAVESWEDLRRELLELNDLVKVLQTEIKVQNRSISHVNAQVDSAGTRVQLADAQLQGTSRVKTYLYPVGGALVGGLVGGAVGGPIGAIAGFKVGAITAAAAGTAGVIGGAFVGFKAKMLGWGRRESQTASEGEGEGENKKTK